MANGNIVHPADAITHPNIQTKPVKVVICEESEQVGNLEGDKKFVTRYPSVNLRMNRIVVKQNILEHAIMD